MRSSCSEFFSGSEFDSELIDTVVDCAYEMAMIYHQDPEVFLAKEIEDLVSHYQVTMRVRNKRGL